jgi:hypothetical protein
LRAKRAIHTFLNGSMDCFVAIAPLRKRFAFVAGNDGVRYFFRISSTLYGPPPAVDR